ncbi:isocitrate lyase/phosphoenolpyruvate mutase family protein [Streptomyces sp. NPDC001508]|uniref:isocitrate lyase/phosphoenolpyruvate mutase family protein n=1 Tax=Streptomyces sp. NPDC001508 TaxID=3154656 RepID=UPI003319B1D2
MADEHSKAITCAELHRSATFVAPNPWDAGSARMLSGHGFFALATTSACLFLKSALGYAGSHALLGRS